VTTTERGASAVDAATPTADLDAAAPPWRLEVRHRPQQASARLAHDVREGLTCDPPSIPPKWFYDETGSLLFDDITRLSEYYPTRTEEAILFAHAGEIAALSRAGTMIELGAGYSRKTRALLAALSEDGRPLLFAPLDVSEPALRETAERVVQEHPGIDVLALVADFEDDLRPLPGEPGRRLVVFLGSTIGNLLPPQRARFLQQLHDATAPGDCLLLGADLVKDRERLVAAYDDAAGTTAAFNKNVLVVLGRELGADLDPEDFSHVAVWDDEHERIEMRLRARRDVDVVFRALDLRWQLAQGQDLLTETSAKFRVPALQAELEGAGLSVLHTWTDDADDFSLTLARRA
jgi:L-histidine N-alpha-methyltransferase